MASIISFAADPFSGDGGAERPDESGTKKFQTADQAAAFELMNTLINYYGYGLDKARSLSKSFEKNSQLKHINKELLSAAIFVRNNLLRELSRELLNDVIPIIARSGMEMPTGDVKLTKLKADFVRYYIWVSNVIE
jgi:hypothetical protein